MFAKNIQNSFRSKNLSTQFFYTSIIIFVDNSVGDFFHLSSTLSSSCKKCLAIVFNFILLSCELASHLCSIFSRIFITRGRRFPILYMCGYKKQFCFNYSTLFYVDKNIRLLFIFTIINNLLIIIYIPFII